MAPDVTRARMAYAILGNGRTINVTVPEHVSTQTVMFMKVAGIGITNTGRQKILNSPPFRETLYSKFIYNKIKSNLNIPLSKVTLYSKCRALTYENL